MINARVLPSGYLSARGRVIDDLGLETKTRENWKRIYAYLVTCYADVGNQYLVLAT